jgi:hypothetical protein
MASSSFPSVIAYWFTAVGIESNTCNPYLNIWSIRCVMSKADDLHQRLHRASEIRLSAKGKPITNST